MLTKKQMEVIEQFVASHKDIQVVINHQPHRPYQVCLTGTISDGFENAGNSDLVVLARFNGEASAVKRRDSAHEYVQERVERAQAYDEFYAESYRRETEYWLRAEFEEITRASNGDPEGWFDPYK